MELIDHALRIRESVRAELEVSVILLPVVVDHEDSGREAVVHDAVGIFQDILLVLIINELNPRIILRHAEEKVRRHGAGSREVRSGSCHERFAQG